MHKTRLPRVCEALRETVPTVRPKEKKKDDGINDGGAGAVVNRSPINWGLATDLSKIVERDFQIERAPFDF